MSSLHVVVNFVKGASVYFPQPWECLYVKGSAGDKRKNREISRNSREMPRIRGMSENLGKIRVISGYFMGYTVRKIRGKSEIE